MSFSIRLRRKNAISGLWETAYTFPVPNAFVSPEINYEYNELEPPTLVRARKVWTIDALLYGAIHAPNGGEAATNAAWATLRDAIETGAQIRGIQLLRDTTIVEDISVEAGYFEVKIERMSSPRSDPQWRSQMGVTLRVSGVYWYATSGAITDLKQTLTYNYGEDGLLTETLAGEVTVKSGSAEAAARTLGLALPSSTFGYLTAGPEGVDVEILDVSLLRARFTSVIKEAGRALPGNVSPGFSCEVETNVQDGEQVTTTTVSAIGPDALTAVKSRRPGGVLVETVGSDDWRRTARATYVQKVKAPNAPLVRSLKFTTSGGGRPIRYTRRNGARRPRPHVGAYVEVTLEEEIVIERFGKPGTTDFKVPRALDGVDEDTSGLKIEGPFLVEIGKDVSGNKWRVVLRRLYKAPDFYAAFVAMAASAFFPGAAVSDIDAEAKRRDEGLQSG